MSDTYFTDLLDLSRELYAETIQLEMMFSQYQFGVQTGLIQEDLDDWLISITKQKALIAEIRNSMSGISD